MITFKPKNKMEIAKIEAKELSLVEDNNLNQKQLAFLLKSTPKKFIKERPAKGGGTWKYVSGSYVRKVLNLMFGWDWSFEVVNEMVQGGQVIVKGKLTCRSNGKEIVKMQFGCKDIMMKKGTQDPLNLGNDFKAATTDCLKKCAAEIGIAGDIYGADEFREIEVVEDEIYSLDDLKALFELKFDKLSEKSREHIQRVIDSKETDKYKFVINQLKSL